MEIFLTSFDFIQVKHYAFCSPHKKVMFRCLVKKNNNNNNRELKINPSIAGKINTLIADNVFLLSII